jgi:hypothetical protein
VNAGKLITEAMQDQRREDWRRMVWSIPTANSERLRAYLMWGWHINGNGGTGKPMWS